MTGCLLEGEVVDVFQHHFNITDVNPGYVYIYMYIYNILYIDMNEP